MKEATIVLDAVEQGVETIHKSDSLSSNEGLLQNFVLLRNAPVE
jgi:hypothetical protein